MSLKTVDRICNKRREKSQLITCDAKISGDPNPVIYARLLHNILNISKAHLTEDGYVIFKTFAKFPIPLTIQIGMVVGWFNDVHLSVPISSSHESSDCFLVIRDPKPELFSSHILDSSKQ